MTFLPLPDLHVDVARSDQEREACFAIRRSVFVEEQRVPVELEYDDLDDAATHFLARLNHQPVATARTIDRSPIVKIGRVAVLADHRGCGIGRSLMLHILDAAAAEGFAKAVLDSQTSALPFYESLRFTSEGAEFLEAGIFPLSHDQESGVIIEMPYHTRSPRQPNRCAPRRTTQVQASRESRAGGLRLAY